jgi:hypothetical protein
MFGPRVFDVFSLGISGSVPFAKKGIGRKPTFNTIDFAHEQDVERAKLSNDSSIPLCLQIYCSPGSPLRIRRRAPSFELVSVREIPHRLIENIEGL